MLVVPPLFFLVAGVSAECAGGGEFTQLVAYHVFGHVHGDEFIAIVHRECMSYEFRGDHGRAAPGLDDVFLAGGIHVGHLLFELHADEGTFFK